ncbi:hypothetical protein ECTOBSL9_0224 [Ectothiorhodospira sp. BSL-9]|nr:hypothetical protein ECTOBSL9_0224 [Ectothiorhodospira sp. BSL-9]
MFQAALQDGRSAFIYTPLIEHKSWPDMGAPLQLMGYRHRIWSRYAQGEVERLRKLPPIITLLVYHGRPPWNVPTCLIDCIDADEDLLALQRDGRYTVKDLSGNAPAYEEFSNHPLLRAGLAALAKPHLVEALTMSLAQEWMDRGEARGVQKGIQQGVQQGEAQTLLRLMERKFGPQARMHCQQRVQQADEAQLLQWIDNILTAERLEDVFQNDASLQ